MPSFYISLEDFLQYFQKYYHKNAITYIKKKYEDDCITFITEYISKKEYEKHQSQCYNCNCCVFRFRIDDDMFPPTFTNIYYNGSSYFALWRCNLDIEEEEEDSGVKMKKPIVKELPYEYLVKNNYHTNLLK